jgi:hypothetical protein
VIEKYDSGALSHVINNVRAEKGVSTYPIMVERRRWCNPAPDLGAMRI